MRRRLHLATLVFGSAAWMLVAPTAARADGTLPPLPYRYLHPPAALSSGNKPPVPGLRVMPADYLRAVVRWAVFTPDSQAGVSGARGALQLGPSATAAVIRIVPVEPPAGLPSSVQLDGNAYRFSISEQPDGHEARILKPVSLTMRWPHLPIAIYAFSGGSWRQLCYADRAILTPNTIGCTTRALGVFAAVTIATTPAPTASSGETPVSWLNRYLPLVILLGVIALSAGVGYLVYGAEKRPAGKGRRRR